MCGIGGIVRPSGLAEADLRCADRLPSLLRHRGPDGAGSYRDRTCALAQTRLALVGAPVHPLPLASPDGRFLIVYNGEIYNFEELRCELGSVMPWVTGTDTEVVLAAWMRWGSGALSRLNGMFAFFIWDAAERHGFGACDPLGIKPLIYHYAHGRFAFASEAGALIDSGTVAFAPDGEAIAEALTAPYFSSAVRLPLAGLQRLPPGHFLELTPDRLAVTRYFCFDHARQSPPDTNAFVDSVAERVQQAVAASMRADAPVGLFLSGGVDSSFIAAVAQRHNAIPLPAWTISYEGEQHADYTHSLIVKSPDLPFAEKVAARHGLSHCVVPVDGSLYESALVRTLQTNDLICAWEQEVSQNLLAAAAAPCVKAVLVGDAADETHFGYSFLLNPARIASPRCILEFFGSIPLRRAFLADPVAHFTHAYEEFARDRGYSWTTPHEQRLAMSCLIHHLWLTRLLHNGDIHLMAHSVEGRVPFGDVRLLALAQTLTQEIGLRDGIEKWHLRRAAERHLDPEIAWRPKSALTKNLLAHRTIHRLFAEAWSRCGAWIEPYVDSDVVDRWACIEPQTEIEVSLRFRLLAVMHWFQRWSGARP